MTIGQRVVAFTKMMQNKFIYVHSNLNQVVRILLHFTTLSFVPLKKKENKISVSRICTFLQKKNDSLQKRDIKWVQIAWHTLYNYHQAVS